MKKIVSLFALLTLMLLAAPKAEAQLNFYNGTPCAVRVFGSFTFNSVSPCSGPFCSIAWQNVPAGAFVTIPGVSPTPCLSPFPPVPANFIRLLVRTTPTTQTGISNCGLPSNTVLDCFGTLRTVQFFSYHLAAIF